MSALLSDQSHRDQALDCSGSYIVQAPAGSGKTELLSLRYLKLLSYCDNPEEVLAITFTRKAASEMRNRILSTLSNVSADPDRKVFDNSWEAIRHQETLEVLRRNEALGWNLLANPSRLRIQTIDSFCLYLAGQLPVLSRTGADTAISEDVEHCFLDAIRNTLEMLDDESSAAEDLARVLAHLDNDINRLEQLLISLLQKRDQWLSHVLGINNATSIDQDYLEGNLAELVAESLNEAAVRLAEHGALLAELCNFAAENLNLQDYQLLSGLPQQSFSALPQWQLLVNLLLTKAGQWRKQVNVTVGFPAGNSSDKAFAELCQLRKQQLTALLAKLCGDDTLKESLAYIFRLPTSGSLAAQWQFLSSLARVLASLSGQLLLSFRRFQVMDYVQAGAAARWALGSSDAPTDLALSLDYRIRHILVDEFQDTSTLQLELLEQLTAGWQAEDGRSLFLVGDAMQSCYGFRNANVGIFLAAQSLGLGSVPLNALTLSSNFRSQAAIVDWVNKVFCGAFPDKPGRSRGAVPYSASSAVKPADPTQGVTAEMIIHEGDGISVKNARELQAEKVARQVLAVRERDPDGSVAILVRYRSHLLDILPALRRAGIQWHATDIDRLQSLPVIEDLMSLTRALVNPGDRIAWLALLRAPWCGLDIADLHWVTVRAGHDSIWSALNRTDSLEGLSEIGCDRLLALTRALSPAMALRYRTGLRRLVESSWFLLQGPATLTDGAHQLSVERFFDLLEEQENAGSIADMAHFGERLNKVFVSPKPTDDSATVQVLTMHKAKGLEFDHVILPSLGRRGRHDDSGLLQWYERVNQAGHPRLFLAALPKSGEDKDPLFALLAHERGCMSTLESTRLLYIACTRARNSLHLLTTLAVRKSGDNDPDKSSLLARIWPGLSLMAPGSIQETKVEPLPAEDGSSAAPGDYPPVTPVRRFSTAIPFSERSAAIIQRHSQSDETTDSADAPVTCGETDTATAGTTEDPLAALGGTLIHQGLEAYVDDPACLSDPQRIQQLRSYWRGHLKPLAIDTDVQDRMLEFIENSIMQSVQSKAYGWIFDSKLTDSRTETVINVNSGDNLMTYVIDRTFVDSQGTRWIVDYKTRAPSENENLETFCHQQCQQHGPQLARYRRLYLEMEGRAVKTALFLSAIPKLIECTTD